MLLLFVHGSNTSRSLEKRSHHLILTPYTLSIYHNQLMQKIFEARPVDRKLLAYNLKRLYSITRFLPESYPEYPILK